MAGLFDKPSLGPCMLEMRPYQEDGIAAVDNEFAKEDINGTLMIMGTGAGKTVVAGEISRRRVKDGQKVLFLAHTEELTSQAINTFDLMGIEAGLEKAQNRARTLFDADVVVGSVQSFNPKRLATWDKDYFSLIICDEAHRSVAPSYTRIFKHFSAAQLLGITATPDRTDEVDLGKVYDSKAYEISAWELMTAPHPGPYLCELRYIQRDVGIDLRGLKAEGEDYTDDQLESVILPMIEVLANVIREEAGHRRTLICTPQIKSARKFAEAMSSMDTPISADWVSGDDPNRSQKIRDFRSGKIQMLAQCQVLNEGADVPEIEAIALCRPTKSRLIYSQQVGRGLRLSPNKEYCALIDFNFLTTTHDLVKPLDFLDCSNRDDETSEIAHDLIQKDKTLSVVQAVKRAEVEHERRVVERIRVREREIKGRRISYNPLDVCETLGIPWRGRTNPDAIIHKATPGQARALTNMGVEGADQMSRARAHTMMDFLGNRRKQGLATVKQVSHLIKNDVPPAEARALSKEDASARLSQIWERN